MDGGNGGGGASEALREASRALARAELECGGSLGPEDGNVLRSLASRAASLASSVREEDRSGAFTLTDSTLLGVATRVLAGAMERDWKAPDEADLEVIVMLGHLVREAERWVGAGLLASIREGG